MIRRFILAFVTAFLLTACGSGTDPVTIKRINSSNGVPLIEFTYTSQQALRSFLKIGELQVVDGTGFCKEVEGVTGTATVAQTAAASVRRPGRRHESPRERRAPWPREQRSRSAVRPAPRPPSVRSRCKPGPSPR